MANWLPCSATKSEAFKNKKEELGTRLQLATIAEDLPNTTLMMSDSILYYAELELHYAHNTFTRHVKPV